MVRFSVAGDDYELTCEQVIERLRHVEPEPIRTHAVEVEGRLFPVKQALEAALNGDVDRADFISTQARRTFRRLGFEVRRLA